MRYFAQIQLSNTNLHIIAEAKRILDEVGVKYSVRDTGNQKYKARYLPCYDLRSFSIPSMRLWLNTLMPYLVGKKDQARMVLEFFDLKRNGGYKSHPERYIRMHSEAKRFYESQEQTTRFKSLLN